MKAKNVNRVYTHEKIPNSRLNQQSSDIKLAAVSCLSPPAGNKMLQGDWEIFFRHYKDMVRLRFPNFYLLSNIFLFLNRRYFEDK